MQKKLTGRTSTMRTDKLYIKIWGVYFGVALLFQLLLPDFPMSFFAFPVNAALVLLTLVGLWLLRKEKPFSPATRLLASPSTTLILLALLAVSCLCLGLTSRPSPSSWWFFFLLAALFLHLLMVFYAGAFRRRPHRLRFILIHGGLLLALLGGFAGAPDTAEWRLPVGKERPTRQAYTSQYGKIRLPHSLQLKDFNVTYYANGMPQEFLAHLLLDNTKNITLSVNHPYTLSPGDDLYLVDYEHVAEPRFCVIQVVRQPWKYVQSTGIWLLLAGCVMLFAQGLPTGMARKEKRTEKGGQP